jgi:DNA-binding PadR family transcriptional regulator
MSLFGSIAAWWNRLPAKQRILDAMSNTEWKRPLDIIKAAKVGIGAFYVNTASWEQQGLVESKWEEGPIPASRQGRRRRLYRLTQAGRRARDAQLKSAQRDTANAASETFA